MKRMIWIKAIVPVAAAAAGLTLAQGASADQTCSALPGATFITGSSAVKPFIAGLGKALAGAAPVNQTLVYKGQGSCLGVDAIFNGTKITGTASYWDATGTELTCNLDLPAGNAADVGVSDVFASSCAGVTGVPATVGDFFGPNQVMNFVVPAASSQALISAQAAYLVFGLGAMGAASPWIDESFIFQRSSTSGTQSMIAAAIRVPAVKWKGVTNATSGAVLTAVTMSAQPEKTIGILSSDVADKARHTSPPSLKILAYQHFDQDCAWYPDSSSTSYDKLNVRDGHYPIWGPLHLFATIDASTKLPVKPEAKTLVGYFTGAVATPAGVNLLDVEIAASTVPACAMKVQRSSEVGDVTPFTPSAPCGCYFDFKATGSTTCATCAQDSDCTGSAKHCRNTYCEAN
jgi:ABC-type phosphate transport system substrate-binding protein